MPKPISPERDRTVILTKESTPASGDKISLRMEILVGSDHGKIFKIDTSGATIGRAGDNRIVLSDETVSGRHARIILQESNYVLEEVNARNGVFVNGNRITRHVIDGNITFRFGAVEGSIMIIRES
jgi:pSer/pThr/pTyr-binding forkhead associated (FHA) protein